MGSIDKVQNERIYRVGNAFPRQYLKSDDNEPYATSCYDSTTNTVQVDYLRDYTGVISTSNHCFSYMGFEEILLHNNRFILHSSLISTELGGIVFSGPSGMGKSTQADLWTKHKGARLINGDRSIFHYENDAWLAYGSPYAGSSNCFVNEGVPVRAIVVLKQGDTCALERMKPLQAFQYLYSQTTVNVWNEIYVQRVCEMEEQLVSQVPIYMLSCTPDQKAVDILYNELMKGGN